MADKQDVNNKIDAMRKDLDARIDAMRAELTAKIEADATEGENKIQPLRTRLDELGREISETQGVIRAAKLILVVGAIAVSILGYLGVGELLKDRANLKKAIESASEATKSASKSEERISEGRRSLAFVTQIALIDNLDAEFGKLPSIDSLRDPGHAETLKKIKKIAQTLKNESVWVDAPDRSQFFMIESAVNAYIRQECNTVINILEKIDFEPDRDRYAYGVMMGICLRKTNRFAEAKRWFERAAKATDARRISILLAGEASITLVRAHKSKNQADIDDAIDQYSKIIEGDKKFAPAYFNLAIAYALKQEYQLTTQNMIWAYEKTSESIEVIVKRIKEDLDEPSEALLKQYVHTELCVKELTSDPDWWPKTRKALETRKHGC